MKNTIRCAKWVASSCVLPVLLYVSNADALGLGDIKVNSYLGESLKAQIPVIELPGDDTQEIKVRLASSEEYRRQNLQYPAGVQFKFELVKNGGRNPYIKVHSLSPIEAPFLDLLVEFTSAAGKITRGYTFLVDPAPDLLVSPSESVVASAVTANSGESNNRVTPDMGGGGKFVFEQGEAKYTESSKRSKSKKNKIKPVTKSDAVSDGFVFKEGGDSSVLVSDKPKAKAKRNKRTGTKRFGKMSMSLSTSLSISKNDPGRIASKDALQEELIAKEKQLKDLNAHAEKLQAQTAKNNVATTTGSKPAPATAPAVPSVASSSKPVPEVIPEVIPAPMGGAAGSDVVTGPDSVTVAPIDAPTVSDVVASSAVQDAPIDMVPPEMPAQPVDAPVTSEKSLLDQLEQYWHVGAAGLVLLLLAGAGVVSYRKRKATVANKTQSPSWNQSTAKSAVGKTTATTTASSAAATSAPTKSTMSLAEKAKSLFSKPKTPKDKMGFSGANKTASTAAVASPSPVTATAPTVATAAVVNPPEATPLATPKVAPAEVPPVTPVAAATSTVSMDMEFELPRVKAPVVEEMEWDMAKPEPVKPVPAPTIKVAQPIAKPAPAAATASGTSSSLKVPEKKVVVENSSVAAPEYDLLEEADIYLRFGHTKLAEEVLREAIKLNGNNAQSYLTLLGIIADKSDTREFAEFAKQLKKLGDEASWQKAAEMGRRIDPSNALYA